jgi:bacteriorhodopsin
MLQSAVEKADDEVTAGGIQRVQKMSIAVWCGFPLVWLLAAGNVLTLQTEEILWSFLDLFAKLILQAALFHNAIQPQVGDQLLSVGL